MIIVLTKTRTTNVERVQTTKSRSCVPPNKYASTSNEMGFVIIVLLTLHVINSWVLTGVFNLSRRILRLVYGSIRFVIFTTRADDKSRRRNPPPASIHKLPSYSSARQHSNEPRILITDHNIRTWDGPRRVPVSERPTSTPPVPR